MGAGLKKDLRVSRVGPEGSLNAFFFLLIRVILQRLAMARSLVQVQDGPAAPGKRIEEASDSFMHAPLSSGGYNSVGRAPLLQLGRYDYSNGEEDRNMPLKDSTETKMGCQERQERRGGRMGSWSDLNKFSSESRNLSHLLYLMNGESALKLKIVCPARTSQAYASTGITQ
ncbi:hypothetical protein Tco_0832128, partial [Tanacetum coccineum]